ncbi:MAG: sigma-70 family RNA polymerase sigma factor [bacterium]|nr:sigma-70 family RNA polymerase sigma factor [bacterium]
MMDEREFMSSYDAYSDAIFRHCFFRLSGREEAKDAVQEVFLRAWKYSQANKIENIRALLYRIAGNIIIDTYRKKKTISLDKLEENGFQPKDNSYEKIMLNTEAKNFIKLLDRLEDKEREVVIMRYVDGFGPDEIADIIAKRDGDEVSPNLISVRLSRAISKLQSFIKQ